MKLRLVFTTPVPCCLRGAPGNTNSQHSHPAQCNGLGDTRAPACMGTLQQGPPEGVHGAPGRALPCGVCYTPEVTSSELAAKVGPPEGPAAQMSD